MGAEHSKTKSQNYVNLGKGRVDEVRAQLKRLGVGESLDLKSFEKVYPGLRQIGPNFIEKFGKNGHLPVSQVLNFADNMLSDHQSFSQALLTIFETPEETISVVTSLFGSQNDFSYGQIEALTQYWNSLQRHDSATFYKFFNEHPYFYQMSESVFSQLIFLKGVNLLPRTIGKVDLMDESAILMVCSNLPNDKQQEWTQLFSSVSHGSSFSRMMSAVNDAGPCVVTIESNSGNVFGFYASDGFHAGPNYLGNETCFLFQVRPQLRTFFATGRTRNYAYLNFQQQSLPNGLGLGGTGDVWPIFLHEEYGTGSSQANSSHFDKCHIAGEENFGIRKLEVWRVGAKPRSAHEDENGVISEKSILDKDPEARAMLEMAGRGLKSDAYRDPAPLLGENE